MTDHHPTILIADDPYTMAAVNLLLATDWRFQVVEKESSLDHWLNRTPRHTSSKSVLVLASDAIHSERIQKICESQFNGKTLLLTGRRRLSFLRQIPPNLVNGILVKQEIGYCLGWALDYACQGFWVTTPSVQSVMPSLRRVVSDPVIVLAQPKHPYDLTPRQEEVFWLGIILQLDHRTIAEELSITEGSSYGLISGLYRRLDIDTLLRGESSLSEFIPEQNLLQETCEQIREEVKTSGTTHCRDKSELVFHLLTHPEIIER